MAYDYVHIPAGCTVKVGDSVGALTDLGVLKGDASIEITYDLVEVLGSKAEELVNYAKNMAANAQLEMYQLNLENIQKLLDGLATVTTQDGSAVNGATQDIPANWTEDLVYILDGQNADGSAPTINSVTNDPDGTPVTLTEDDDYFLVKTDDGWGIAVISTGTNTADTTKKCTVDYDYTPAASKTLKMGSKSASITSKIVEFSKTINSKVFRARLWKATNESGLNLSFPDSAGDEPASIPVTMTGRIDENKSDGEQLIEIYDEIGVAS